LEKKVIEEYFLETGKTSETLHSFLLITDTDKRKQSNSECHPSICNLILQSPHKAQIQYILESNPHPFYSFRGLKNKMRIRFAVVSWILEK
jgi:hypothetical protein